MTQQAPLDDYRERYERFVIENPKLVKQYEQVFSMVSMFAPASVLGDQVDLFRESTYAALGLRQSLQRHAHTRDDQEQRNGALSQQRRRRGRGSPRPSLSDDRGPRGRLLRDARQELRGKRP